MDKLKIFLAVLKKHQFWVFCGIMLVTTLACWWLATGGLASQFTARVSSINSDFNGAKVQSGHPNQDHIDKIDKDLHKSLRENVFNAWQALYSEQQDKNPFPADLLGEGFEKQFKKLKLPQGRLDDIYREKYQTFIKNYLPRLLKMIDVRRASNDKDYGAYLGDHGASARPDAPPMAPGRGPMGPFGNLPTGDKELVGLVDWDSVSFEKLKAHFAWSLTPSTLQVVIAQEDLWVYEALVRVIQNVNKNVGATNQSNAAVKRILALEIGRDSRDAWRLAMETVVRAGAGGSPVGGMPPQGPRMGPPGGMMPGGPGGGGTAAENQYEHDLFVDRYVDDKGGPLSVADAYPYVTHVPPEYKIMPVRLHLQMDQRYLPKLLVECANSSMPIEVKRVRLLKVTFDAVNIDSPQSKPGGPSGASPYGPPMPYGPMMPPRGGGYMPPSDMRPGGSDKQDAAAGEFDVPVDIYALIYIYNPPDLEKLGIPAPTNDPAAAGGSGDPAAAKTATPGNPVAPPTKGK
jgi:hypothetical protein